jgi:hypothetical protein
MHKQRPRTAQGVPLFAPVATAALPHHPHSAPMAQAAAPLPRAELVYDGSAAAAFHPPNANEAVVHPTAPPIAAAAAAQGQQDVYRVDSGTARW